MRHSKSFAIPFGDHALFAGKLQAGLQVVDTVTGPDLSAVDVQYVLAGQGYHRTLRATLWRNTDDNSANGHDMTYVMAVNITSNFYIDLDQVL